MSDKILEEKNKQNLHTHIHVVAQQWKIERQALLHMEQVT